MNRFAAALALCTVFILPVEAASAATFTVVHTFPANTFIFGGLVMDNKGNMWGTTDNGGAKGFGSIFEITAKGVYVPVHDFGGADDGGYPQASMIEDKQHNLWGTTSGGTIYEITAGGTYSVAYHFCSNRQNGDCLDGETPTAPLFLDNQKNLVGTTELGGAGANCSSRGYECGIVFKFNPVSGVLTVMHNFANDGVDGLNPLGGIIQDKKHNYWGTTWNGGPTGPTCTSGSCGTIFEITTKGAYSVVRDLCTVDCSDGAKPYAGLFKDKAGNLWGTLGAAGVAPAGIGTVYKIDTTGVFSVVKSFENTNPAAADGLDPQDSLIQDKLGTIWGTTLNGGNQTGSGTVFEIAPDGTFSNVYDFCSQPNCADGNYPSANLTLGKKGTIWGTTAGASYSARVATVFKITP